MAPVAVGDRLDRERGVLAVEGQRRDLVGVRRPLDHAPVERQRFNADAMREAACEAFGEGRVSECDDALLVGREFLA